MPIDYYSKLLNLVTQGRLTIRLIIAPTRSGSTRLEECLSMSPDIDYKFHEPFLWFDSRGPAINPLAYKLIYERIGGSDFEKSSQSTTVVIKDFAFWLYTFGEYKRLFDLAKDPILFLIRNPVLSMESRMQKIAEALPAENLDHPTRQAIIKLCGQQVARETSDRCIFDLFAALEGFTNWKELLDFSIKHYKYESIGKVLNVSKAWFFLNIWGSDAMEGEISYLENLNRRLTLVDSSEFRLSAEKVAQAICNAWSLRYEKRMISWGKGNLHLDPAANTLWFARIAASSEVQPPTEVPLILKEFPPFIKHQLAQKDIPTYVRLMRHPAMITHKGVCDISFNLPVPDHHHKRLQELGVIDGLIESSFLVNIRDVDPLFTLCREPHLTSNSFYLRQKKAYSDVIEIICLS